MHVLTFFVSLLIEFHRGFEILRPTQSRFEVSDEPALGERVDLGFLHLSVSLRVFF
jgi:hypothetical protein